MTRIDEEPPRSVVNDVLREELGRHDLDPLAPMSMNDQIRRLSSRNGLSATRLVETDPSRAAINAWIRGRRHPETPLTASEDDQS